MTTSRHPRRRGAAAAIAGLFVLAATTLAGAPAFADPSPQPPTHAPASASPAPAAATPPVPSGSVPSGPNAVGAPGTISWSVQPATVNGPDGRSTFTYTNLMPGITIHDYVAVTNFSAVAVTFSLSAADAFTNTKGDLDLRPAADKPRDLGSWVSLSRTSITIQPHERVNEAFTITIPSTATPGDHGAGLIASTLLSANNQGVKVNVDRRLAVPVFLRVAGPLHAGIAIESVSTRYSGTYNPIGGGGIDVSYTVRNTGNERVDLSQTVGVYGFFAIPLARTHPKTLKNLLPGGGYQATVHVTGVFPTGLLRVRAEGMPQEPGGLPPSKPKPESVAFGVTMWATPWLIIIIIVVAVGAFFGVRWVLRLRSRQRADATAAAVEKARRETVEQLRKKAAAKVGAGSGKGAGTGGKAAGTGKGAGTGGSGKDASG
jgi:hypothetical protein